MHSERCLQAAAAACVRADATSACLRSTFATRVYAAHRRVEAVARILDQACHAAFAGRLCALRWRGMGRRAVFVLLPAEAGVPDAFGTPPSGGSGSGKGSERGPLLFKFLLHTIDGPRLPRHPSPVVRPST
jgi:hypothetical protein